MVPQSRSQVCCCCWSRSVFTSDSKWGVMHSRHFRFLRENWYRDVWLIIISVVVLWSSISTYQNGQDTYQNQQDQRTGRRVALGATCAAVSGVIEAGRATIAS